LRGGEIIIAVDHACMNKLKEEKPKNYDATELVGREFQSPFRLLSFLPHQLGPQKQMHWLKMTLTFTKK